MTFKNKPISKYDYDIFNLEKINVPENEFNPYKYTTEKMWTVDRDNEALLICKSVGHYPSAAPAIYELFWRGQRIEFRTQRRYSYNKSSQFPLEVNHRIIPIEAPEKLDGSLQKLYELIEKALLVEENKSGCNSIVEITVPSHIEKMHHTKYVNGIMQQEETK